MELILAVLAGITAVLFVYTNVMAVVQLCRKKLSIESLVYQSYQVILVVILFIWVRETGFTTYFYAFSILGMWVFIPQLWSLSKGDERQLHVKVKDNTPSPGPF